MKLLQPILFCGLTLVTFAFSDQSTFGNGANTDKTNTDFGAMAMKFLAQQKASQLYKDMANNLEPEKIAKVAKKAYANLPEELKERGYEINKEFDFKEAGLNGKKFLNRYKKYVNVYEKKGQEADYLGIAKRAAAETAAEYKGKLYLKSLTKKLLSS